MVPVAGYINVLLLKASSRGTIVNYMILLGFAFDKT